MFFCSHLGSFRLKSTLIFTGEALACRFGWKWPLSGINGGVDDTRPSLRDYTPLTTLSVLRVKGCTHKVTGALACDCRYRCIERVCRLLVNLSFVIFAIFDVKRQLKLLEMACDQVQTCLIFPLRWAGFPIKIGRNAQWEHLFPMYLYDFLPISLIFWS